jgi:predicted nucleic acid-binding protein
MKLMRASHSALAFIDTNVLLYAHDHDAGDKQAVAASLLASCWESGNGLLSPQVLQEFLVNAIRKLQRPIALAQARDIVRAYGTWVVRDAGVSDILRATELMELTGYSFWDSHILANA